MSKYLEYVFAFLITALWLIIGAETCVYVTRCLDAVLNMDIGGRSFCIFCAVIVYVVASWFVWDCIRS